MTENSLVAWEVRNTGCTIIERGLNIPGMGLEPSLHDSSANFPVFYITQYLSYMFAACTGH